MTSEWLIANSTLIAALAGMVSTVFVAVYMTHSNLRNTEAERRHNAYQLVLTERKSAYKKILQAFEEFDDTIYVLHGNGYTGHGRPGVKLTGEVHALLDRNSKADLTIQDLERELELIAPLEVVKACRITFRTLREKTKILINESEVRRQPYNSHLAETVRLMRADLERLNQSDLGKKNTDLTDFPEQDFMSLYDELLAPENVFSRQG